MLARHFPPIGGAGVHRSVGYARHLPGYGYQPTVVTGPGAGLDRWSPEDPGLLKEVPAHAEVHRVKGPEPEPRTGRRARLDRWLQRPQPWVRWWVDAAVEKGLEVGGRADIVLGSCIPYETAEAGARLASELGVPWVADLEDPWALDDMRVQPTALHRRVDFARMRRALDSASAIVTSAPETAERFREALPEHAHKLIAAVPIGFDSHAFAAAPPIRPADPGAPIRIVHSGSLHTELGEAHRRSRRWRRLLGGNSVDVDILTRSAVVLLEALDTLVASHPELAGRFELHLAGDLTARDRAVVEGHGFVRLHGQLGHRETVALMRSADLLFLPLYDLPPGRRAGIIPYKTYEYLAARRPILAAVPDGDVRDMLEPLPHATVCRPADVEAIARAVRARVGAGAGGDVVAPGLASPPLVAYDRRLLVGQAAAVLDDVLGPVDTLVSAQVA